MGMFDWVGVYYKHPNIRIQDITPEVNKSYNGWYQTKDLISTTADFIINMDGTLKQKTFPNMFGWDEDGYILNTEGAKIWYFYINRCVDYKGYPTHKYKEEAIYIFTMLGNKVREVEQFILPYKHTSDNKDFKRLEESLRKYRI